MMVDLWHNVGSYFYDVFVRKLDWWGSIGIFGQLIFGARFFVQWIASERAGHVVLPSSFWIISIVGGLITLVYALHQRELAFILGQGSGLAIYLRNLWFVMRDRKAKRKQAASAEK